MAATESIALQTRRRAPLYGPRVWGWGLWSGIAFWALGFAFLPWWAALFLWWWPSLLVGAAIGLFAVWVASRIAARRSAAASGSNVVRLRAVDE